MRGYEPGYKHLLVNLFEHTLLNAAGRVLTEQSPHHLELSPADLNALEMRLRPLGDVDLRDALAKASEQICSEMSITDSELSLHVLACLEKTGGAHSVGPGTRRA